MAKLKPLEWTVEAACRELGVSRGAFSSRVATSGVKPDAKGRFTTAQIFSIMHGDIDSEKLRKVRGEADKLELDNRRTRGELISVEDATAIAQRFAAATRQIVVMSKLSAEDKNAFLGEMRALAEVDWTKIDSYFDEED